MCGITKLCNRAVCALLLVSSCYGQQANTTNQSKFDTGTLKYEGCKPGQSKTVNATVTVTDQNGRSASRSTKITVNCEPPYERFADLIFAKNEARVNACSRNILLDQVAAAANSGDYTVILIGHRAAEESETLGNFGPELDQSRALNAAAVLVRCARLKPSSIRIDSAGAAKNPVPTSVACPEYVAAKSDAEWYGRVEVYLQPRDGKYLPENAKHLASLPPELPDGESCGDTPR
jgi:outer membrane protein OmpA-like peptidoglycan-associated protein